MTVVDAGCSSRESVARCSSMNGVKATQSSTTLVVQVFLNRMAATSRQLPVTDTWSSSASPCHRRREATLLTTVTTVMMRSTPKPSRAMHRVCSKRLELLLLYNINGITSQYNSNVRPIRRQPTAAGGAECFVHEFLD